MDTGRYLQYKLVGFSGLKLEKNSVYHISNKWIKTILLDENVSILTVVLNDDILYCEHIADIETYLNHICFNLITETEADISMPIRYLELIKDGSNMQINDHITLRDSISITRIMPAESVYSAVVNAPTDFENHAVIYERIFKTLHNPNLIVQFMSLYQLLMELLANGGKIEQRNVVDYFKNNKSKYPFISFRPTRNTKVKVSYDEDSFTYFRNEIGHSEDTNDMEQYKSLGSQVSSQTIKKLVKVINDVIITML